MWLTNVLSSAAGRAASMGCGLWLLVQGTTLSSGHGVVMAASGGAVMLAGLACIVVGLTGLGLPAEGPRQRKA